MSIRGTYSSDLATTAMVNLPENDEWIRRIAANARIVVVSWGNPGHKSGRGATVETILREVCDPAKVFCFGRNKNQSPVHPLYQRLDARQVLEDGDPTELAAALGDIARTRSMTQLAKDTGLSRESLYKSLSGERAPSSDTLFKVIRALGFKLTLQPVTPT